MSNEPALTLSGALTAAAARLARHHNTARLDAEVLLAYVLQKPRSHLAAWPELPLSAEQAQLFFALVQRRAGGEPAAYLTGRREFWSLNLAVSSATLIPRPETEALVDIALQHIHRHEAQRIADIGTGSGAIALAIASERPDSHVIATDISHEALEIAQRNAQQHKLANMEFRAGDLFTPVQGERFHVIVSNPPYVREGDPHLDQNGLPFEPRTALVAGPDGMEIIEKIAHEARGHLHPGGWLIMEHGYDQGEAALSLLNKLGYGNVRDYRDSAGQPRVIAGQYP